jgi:DNA-binding IclR family transcriptional regulator
MPYNDLPLPPCGVGHKCDIVFRAICEGKDNFDVIAETVGLPMTTVIRVVALLVELGHVAVDREPQLTLRPSAHR